MTLVLGPEQVSPGSAGMLRWALAPMCEIRRLVEDGRGHEVVERLQRRPYEELRTSPELAVLFATALVGEGRLEDAHRLSAVALSAARALGDNRGEMLATMLCGDIAAARGDLEGASACFIQARALAREQRNGLLAGQCSAQVGQIALRRDDPAMATQAFLAAIATYESIGAHRDALQCQTELARAYAARDEFENALGTLDRAVDAARDAGDPKLRADIVLTRAQIRLTAGDPAVALSEAVRAAAMYRSLDDGPKEGDALQLAKRAQAELDPPRQRAPHGPHTRTVQHESVHASCPELIERCHV